MFIEIKKRKIRQKEYINMFKITSIKNFQNDEDGGSSETRIEYTCSGHTVYVTSYEPFEEFMRRLKREIKEIPKGIENRFEILDL